MSIVTAATPDLFENETPVAIGDVPSMLPIRRGGKLPHISCVYRWIQKGVRGVKLEVIDTPGGMITTKEAIARFFAALSAARRGLPTTPASRTPSARQRAAQSADRELAAAGW